MSKSLAWTLLTVTIFCNTGASLLLKRAAGVYGASQLPWGAASIVCYGLAFLTYYGSLRALPVSIAYPVATGWGIMMIAVAAARFMGESLTETKALGIVLVVLGSILLSRS